MVWEASTGEHVATLVPGKGVFDDGYLQFAAYSADGKLIATPKGCQVVVWNANAVQDGGVFYANETRVPTE